MKYKNYGNDFIVFKSQKNTVLYHIPTKRRFLFSKDAYSDFKAFIDEGIETEKVKNFLKENLNCIEEIKVENTIKRIEIMTCTCCNLNCKYCYAHGGNYNLNEQIMTIHTNNLILDKIKLLSDKIKEVKFFGGEPFLGYKCILNTCEWFSNNYKKVPKFKVVTNLTYLPEELLIGIKKYNIILTVSLDGPEEINNELRISKDMDINVFETVKNNIRRLRKIGCPIQAVECTFTQKHKELGYTKDWLEQYFKHEFGVKQVIVAEEYHPENKCRFSFEYRKLFNDEKIINPVELELISRCLSKEHTGGGLCQVGNSALTFLPNGDVYPCHLFIYNNTYKIGNILDKRPFKQIDEVRENLNNIRKKVGCDECKARNLCSQCFKDFIFDTDEKMIECKEIIKMNEYCIAKICGVNIKTTLSDNL